MTINNNYTYWKILEEAKKEFKGISYLRFNIEQLLVLQPIHKYIKDDIFKYNKKIYYSILNWDKFEQWYWNYHGLYNNFCVDLYRQVTGHYMFPFYEIFELRYKWIKLGLAKWSNEAKNNIEITKIAMNLICNIKSSKKLMEIWDSIDNKNNIDWEKYGVIIKNPYLFQDLITILSWPEIKSKINENN